MTAMEKLRSAAKREGWTIEDRRVNGPVTEAFRLSRTDVGFVVDVYFWPIGRFGFKAILSTLDTRGRTYQRAEFDHWKDVEPLLVDPTRAAPMVEVSL